MTPELLSDLMNPSPPRTRSSAADSKQTLIEACIDLLATKNVQEVTNALLEETTGLNRSYVTRYFGNRNAMFVSVVRELDARIALAIDPSGAGVGELDVIALLERPETDIRIRVTMWLLSNGVPASDFVDGDLPVLVRTQERISAIFGISPRAARTFAFQSLLMFAGSASIGGTFGTSDADMVDLEHLVRAQLFASAETAAALGW
jgi:AcrR family transcriptional regulator